MDSNICFKKLKSDPNKSTDPHIFESVKVCAFGIRTDLTGTKHNIKHYIVGIYITHHRDIIVAWYDERQRTNDTIIRLVLESIRTLCHDYDECHITKQIHYHTFELYTKIVFNDSTFVTNSIDYCENTLFADTPTASMQTIFKPLAMEQNKEINHFDIVTDYGYRNFNKKYCKTIRIGLNKSLFKHLIKPRKE